MVHALSSTFHNKCTRKLRWLIGPHCRGSACSDTPSGKCVRPSSHGGKRMCANCQTDLIHRVSQRVARRDGFNLLDEEHDTTPCTRLWATRYKYIYDRVDSPSTDFSSSSDCPWDKPCKEIPRYILLEEGMLERKFDGAQRLGA